jgi:hypothetical protein
VICKEEVRRMGLTQIDRVPNNLGGGIIPKKSIKIKSVGDELSNKNAFIRCFAESHKSASLPILRLRTQRR